MSRKPQPRAARPPDPEDGRRRITDFVPPEGVPIRFDVAGLSARLVAQMADIIITLAGLVVIMTALFFSNIVPFVAVVSIGALLFFAIRVPYYILSEILMNGQTLGKRIAGLRVISADGRTLTAHSVTIRNLMKEMEVFVPGTMLLAASALDPLSVLILMAWIAILLAVPLTNRNRQRLGDILAGTYVVSLPTPVLLPDLTEAPVPDTAYSFQPHQLDHYGRYELQTLEALLQVNAEALSRIAAERHAANLKKVAETIARRIGYEIRVPEADAPAFLLAFYRTQRGYLESRKLFGDAREDKYHRGENEGGDRPKGVR